MQNKYISHNPPSQEHENMIVFNRRHPRRTSPNPFPAFKDWSYVEMPVRNGLFPDGC
jgi:hypothetical protein